MKIFDKVPIKRPSKNVFNLSHDRKMSMRLDGALYVAMVQEILPGDEFQVNSEVFLRFQAMLAPIMHRVTVKMETFFTPTRLVWDQKEFDDFITGGREGTSNPVYPYIEVNSTDKAAGLYATGSLWDYIGLPSIAPSDTVTSAARVSALPFRTYQLIYNEYYRNQNLEPDLNISTASGAVSGAESAKILTTRYCGWEKDYFTSALPWAQRGPTVTMPVEGDVDFEYSPFSQIFDTAGNPINVNKLLGTTAGTGGRLSTKDSLADAGSNARVENLSSVSISNVTTTINDLRKATKLQEFLEIMARVGARYTEYLRGIWDVFSSDGRLQRPEFITGGNVPVRISEVLSTFQDPADEGLPQGNMAGHGYSAGSPTRYKRFFEEHGILMTMIRVVPKTAYQQGIPRWLQRFDRLDHPVPQFAHLGEQEIRNRELYYDFAGSDNQNSATWGYIPRYAECKYANSSVHGQMRTTLDFWHMGRKFAALPALNVPFVKCDPTNRIFAVQEEGTEHVICVIFHNVKAKRRLPYFGTPSL